MAQARLLLLPHGNGGVLKQPISLAYAELVLEVAREDQGSLMVQSCGLHPLWLVEAWRFVCVLWCVDSSALAEITNEGAFNMHTAF